MAPSRKTTAYTIGRDCGTAQAAGQGGRAAPGSGAFAGGAAGAGAAEIRLEAELDQFGTDRAEAIETAVAEVVGDDHRDRADQGLLGRVGELGLDGDGGAEQVGEFAGELEEALGACGALQEGVAGEDADRGGLG